MDLSLFIACRLYRGEGKEKLVSRPAVLIAMTGIAIGLAVMIVSVAVITGFKGEIRDKIVGFGSHLQITNLETASIYDTHPVSVDSTLWHLLNENPDVAHVQRYSTKAGMLKTADSFQGMLLKGIAQDYDTDFFRQHLVEGELPCFTDSVATNQVLISQTVADKMNLHLGDKIDTYYIQDNVRARRFTVAGIYSTNFAEYDNLFFVTDLYTVNRLNNWQADFVGGLEVRLHDYARLEGATWDLAAAVEGITGPYGERYFVCNAEQQNPQIFAWLGVLDVNIWVILALMTGVAGFTMISGLLIIIIERTSMIGILKSLGAGNGLVRRVFLWFSVFLIGRGMVWGNVLGLAFCGIQYFTGVFSLDPENYYMDTVPVSVGLGWLVLLNAGTLLVSVAMLLGPSYLIARIRPSDSMRYE